MWSLFKEKLSFSRSLKCHSNNNSNSSIFQGVQGPSQTLIIANLKRLEITYSPRCVCVYTTFSIDIFMFLISLKIKNIILGPVRHVSTTRSSTQSHPFQVTLPNPGTLAHKSSFIPRTSQLWNTLPSTSTAFPKSYSTSSFKSSINKLNLISLST